MAVNNKSSLSAGEIIRQLLMDDPEVSSRVNKVFPVVIEGKAKLPYIVYRRTNLNQDVVKDRKGADTVGIEITCYTDHYTPGVELAEAVRNCLDNHTSTKDGMVMRSCYLADSSEDWEDDAYIQTLMFNIKI